MGLDIETRANYYCDGRGCTVHIIIFDMLEIDTRFHIYGWTVRHEKDRIAYYCPACTEKNIEADMLSKGFAVKEEANEPRPENR